MLKQYHIQITTQALQAYFSPRALQTILDANVNQDNLAGQIRHPEYHFDDNHFDQGYAYLNKQRQLVHEALARTEPVPAWQAFGRLTHAVQDFYAHSNYIHLWIARQTNSKNGQAEFPPPEDIDPFAAQALNSPELISGRLYYPWELLSFLPGLAPIMRRLLPKDSHTYLNLDSPKQGVLYPYAQVAARKRTVREFERLRNKLASEAMRIFTDQATTTDN